MVFILRILNRSVLAVAMTFSTLAQANETEQAPASIMAEVRDIDPANRQKVLLESTGPDAIFFRWCDVNKEGAVVCLKNLGCRQGRPYTAAELLDKKSSKRWAAYGVVGIDLGIMAAMIGGGWRLFKGSGAKVLAGEGMVLEGTLLGKNPVVKGMILAADGETILSAGSLTSTGGAGALLGAAQTATQTAPLLLTTLKRLSTWSFLGISFTGLMVKYTKKLDPSIKYREAEVIDKDLWTTGRDQIWPLEEYRKTLQKVLCEIDGYQTHAY